MNQQKESARAEKKQVNEEKLLKKAEKAAAEEIKRNDLLPGMMVELEKGAEHILNLSNKRMGEFIKYHFQINLPGLPSMKKDALQKVLRPLLLPAEGVHDESMEVGMGTNED